MEHQICLDLYDEIKCGVMTSHFLMSVILLILNFLNFHILDNALQKTPQRELNDETFAEI